MKKAPEEIGGARVVLYTPLDGRHRHTGNRRQVVAGELMGPAPGPAICRYAGESSYYLFGCDGGRGSVTDTWHERLQDAKARAGFEYEGVSSTWPTPEG